MSQQTNPENKNDIKIWRGEISKKHLKCSADATEFQKNFMRDMSERIAAGEQLIFGDGPREVITSMGFHHLNQVFYGSLIAAKQQSGYYRDRLKQEGYLSDQCSYCCLALGCLLDKNPEIAPWGGLAKPVAVIGEAEAACDTNNKILQLYARNFNVPYYNINRPQRVKVPPRWWESEDWAEPHAVEQEVKQQEALIRFLESLTGKVFSETKLGDTLDMSDETSEYYWKATELACTTIPAPMSVTDAFANSTAYNWHQGIEWGLAHAKKYYAEVKERVDQGKSACANERVRLLWGEERPIWFSLGFYNHWEESHGAVFLPVNYMEVAQRLIYHDHSSPLYAMVKRRHLRYHLPSPTAAVEYILYQVKKYKIDGVICPMNYSCRLGHQLFIAEALEKDGIPVLKISYDPLGAAAWNDAEMKEKVTTFIEGIQKSKKELLTKKRFTS
jgi:benzoyl-CoA reductase subunit B